MCFRFLLLNGVTINDLVLVGLFVALWGLSPVFDRWEGDFKDVTATPNQYPQVLHQGRPILQYYLT